MTYANTINYETIKLSKKNIRQESCVSIINTHRTKPDNQKDEYLEVGADEVVSEKFETSIEIFSQVLHNYLIPVHK
ncbi:MAG: hypothetical protein JKZ03_00990 [Flavobacteriaceae bacterium]|nr:hypothetical protein [Flavobacteriaceae bacterium]